jgi:hypothetical protein
MADVFNMAGECQIGQVDRASDVDAMGVRQNLTFITS